MYRRIFLLHRSVKRRMGEQGCAFEFSSSQALELSSTRALEVERAARESNRDMLVMESTSLARKLKPERELESGRTLHNFRRPSLS